MLWDRYRKDDPGISFSYDLYPNPQATNIYVSNVAGYLNPLPNSILLLTEPPEIQEFSAHVLSRFKKVIGPDFCNEALGENHILSSPLLPNFVGISFPRPPKHFMEISSLVSRRKPIELITLDEIRKIKYQKRNVLSVIVSSKEWTPLQKLRRDFIKYLHQKQEIKIELFGEQNHLKDKFESLKFSKWSLAVENSRHPFYFSEKLTDAIISGSHSFYSGAPNIGDFFTSSCYTELPIEDFVASSEIIQSKMESETKDFNFKEDQFEFLRNHTLEGWISQNLEKLE
jgi:hypothetical protein